MHFHTALSSVLSLDEPCERIFVMLRLLRKSEVQPTMFPDAEPGVAFAMGCVARHRFAKAVRRPLVLAGHILCKCY